MSRIPLNDAVAQQAGDTLQVLRLGVSRDPDGEVRTRYRLNGPGWVLVRPDQVVAARGVGADFSALHTYVARGVRPKPRRRDEARCGPFPRLQPG